MVSNSLFLPKTEKDLILSNKRTVTQMSKCSYFPVNQVPKWLLSKMTSSTRTAIPKLEHDGTVYQNLYITIPSMGESRFEVSDYKVLIFPRKYRHARKVHVQPATVINVIDKIEFQMTAQDIYLTEKILHRKEWTFCHMFKLPRNYWIKQIDAWLELISISWDPNHDTCHLNFYALFSLVKKLRASMLTSS